MTSVDDSVVTLYSQPGCGPCMGVSRALDAQGISYTVRNVREDEAAAARVQELGYTGTPVVEHPGGHFQGFLPDKIEELSVSLF